MYRELQIVLAVLASLVIAYLGTFNILSDIGTFSAICADPPRKRLRSMAGFVNNTDYLYANDQRGQGIVYLRMFNIKLAV
ncbi:MAG: hypothetical protein LBR98_01240 [Syntrophomonadaceae bacterium]|nr:hypothetical protein [Syntrophomonadaceae bacterium]